MTHKLSFQSYSLIFSVQKCILKPGKIKKYVRSMTEIEITKGRSRSSFLPNPSKPHINVVSNMALCLLVAGSYAAYQANKKQQQALLLAAAEDSEKNISLQGKTKIQLLPLESNSSMAIMELPFTCINWFEGDYRTIQESLKRRVQEILEKNPFLAGWLIFDKEDDLKLKVVYDQNGEDICPGTFRIFDEKRTIENDTESGDDKHPQGISFQTGYDDCCHYLLACGAMLPMQQKLIGQKDQPLFRVSIIPDADDPSSRFALVVSMAHALGDSHTFYQLIRMLDVQAQAQILIPDRAMDFPEARKKSLGEESFEYLLAATKEPPMDWTETRNEPTVRKTFVVNESWFHKNDKRARRSSLFANVANDFHDDTNHRARDLVSENSILTSWFFRLNQADIGFMSVSLRDRLCESCSVSPFHAGHYTGGIPYAPIDFATPVLVEESVGKLQRCGTSPDNNGPTKLPPFRWNHKASISLNWATYFQHKLQLSPTAQTKPCQQLTHRILYDAEILNAVPGRLSLCCMFTADPSDSHDDTSITTTTGEAAAAVAAEVALEESGEMKVTLTPPKRQPNKRAGVLVLCKQSVWEQIENSGIVDEMIE